MLKLMSIFFLLTLSTFSAFADENSSCTAWKQDESVSCIFAGEAAKSFSRQCENNCRWDRYGRLTNGPDCDRESLCNFKDPSTFGDVCSEWTPSKGVVCHNPNTDTWEQKWERSCTIGVKETWCSKEIPQL